MLRIGQLAKAKGINPQTLRFYEKIGLIPKPAREQNRYRQYGPIDIQRVEFIQKTKALGLSLPEIRHILDIKLNGKRPCDEVRRILEEKLQQIDGQIAFLKSLSREMQAHLTGLPEEGLTGEICGCIETHKILLKKSP